MPGQNIDLISLPIKNIFQQPRELSRISIATTTSLLIKIFQSKTAGDHGYLLENATFDLIGRNDVGYVLSGGVDSTLVALSMAEKDQHARKIKTFTLEFGAKDPQRSLQKT